MKLRIKLNASNCYVIRVDGHKSLGFVVLHKQWVQDAGSLSNALLVKIEETKQLVVQYAASGHNMLAKNAVNRAADLQTFFELARGVKL